MQFHVRIGGPAEVQATSGEVLRTFARAAREEPADADYDYILGEALLRAGRAGEAAERYREAVRLDRLNPDYHLALGHALWRLGRFEEAESSLREAVRLRSDATSLNAHGATLLRLSRPIEAERVLQQAVRADRGMADAYGNLAAVRWELGRRGEAIAILRRGCRKAPSDHSAHRNLGVALLESGQPAAAVAAFRTAAACAPDDAGAHLDLAEALAEAGRGDEAGGALAEAARLNPGAIASRPAALQARNALRLQDLSEHTQDDPVRTLSLTNALAHTALVVLQATSWLRLGKNVTALLVATPLVALAWAGACVAPHWFRHHLLSDDVAAVARAPVEDDVNVRDRLSHAVSARGMESLVDPERCTVHTQSTWRRITCAYSVPVEVLPGWTHTLEFQIDVEQPFVVNAAAPRD
jgi:tetratricopeptide (TPR) repeat protein